MSRTERNARREAEKRKTARRLRIRDCAVIFACLVFMFAYISALSTITSEPEFIPEYVFAGNTSKNVPVYLIGIPIEEEEAADEKGNGQKEETSQETAEENGEETAEEVAAEGQDSRTVKAVKVGKLVRGSSVKKLLGYQEVDGVVYCKVGNTGLDETADLYMKEENLVLTADKVVQEKEVYVRTPVTIYSKETGPSIASFAPKGTCLKVTGYDRMLSYLVSTQKKADKVYNKNGIYDKVKKDNYGFNLYGGKAKNLDYYPYERAEIEGNKFLKNARAMYLNCAAAANPDSYIDLIEKTDCNAVVVDIKDGVLAWPAKTAKKLSPKSYRTAFTTYKKYKKGINRLKKTGVYTIGRIVVFNDPIYAKDHPEDCIKYGGKAYWPSAYSRDVWEYNVKLAREAIKEFGFNEIQFDYVRFPENSYDMSKSKSTNFRNYYDEEKGQAIQNFCFYAADQIHEAGAYLSVDVFGESAYGYMTAYGQYWPGISNIVDAISAMPYTDHMGGQDTWKNPYNTMKTWAKRAKKGQDYLEHPAAARTWITGYNTPHWNPTVNYGEKELKAQIKGLKDAGLKGGFIPWNANNDLGKYKQYKAIWNKD